MLFVYLMLNMFFYKISYLSIKLLVDFPHEIRLIPPSLNLKKIKIKVQGFEPTISWLLVRNVNLDYYNSFVFSYNGQYAEIRQINYYCKIY